MNFIVIILNLLDSILLVEAVTPLGLHHMGG